jgi:hypothetical protein
VRKLPVGTVNAKVLPEPETGAEFMIIEKSNVFMGG